MAHRPVLERICSLLLKELPEDLQREGLKKTPARFAKALEELTVGYHQDGDTIVNDALFEAPSREMIVVKDIEFYSLCEHHILPFFGKASVGYIPDGKIVGLSKIPRIINMFARRLQLQERLTTQVTEELTRILQPKGVACVIEASHLCMMMRGVQTQSALMTTSSMTGHFLTHAPTRQEFLEIIRNG